MDLYIFYKDEIIIKDEIENFIIPSEKDFLINENFNFKPFKLSSKKESYLMEIEDKNFLPKGFKFENIKKCRRFYENKNYATAIEAKAILNWERNHRYCGVCGEKLPSMNNDKSKKCPKCKNLFFPELACAIIVGITNGDKLLLAHNSNFLKNRYSILAGFVELGESLEDAVRREIKEEVNINVKNLKYFGSQPWPFPNSIMLGFTAEYQSGEMIPDGFEIERVNWFSKDEIPEIPPYGSISRKIIDFCFNKF